MTGTLLKRLEQHIWWSSQKHVLPPRGALRKSSQRYVAFCSQFGNENFINDEDFFAVV